MLFNEIRSRVTHEDCSVPERVDDYLYYTRAEPGQEFPVYCRRWQPESGGSFGDDAGGGVEQILLDQNRLAEGASYCQFGTIKISSDHALMAYTLDTTGEERFQVRVLDLRFHADGSRFCPRSRAPPATGGGRAGGAADWLVVPLPPDMPAVHNVEWGSGGMMKMAGAQGAGPGQCARRELFYTVSNGLRRPWQAYLRLLSVAGDGSSVSAAPTHTRAPPSPGVPLPPPTLLYSEHDEAFFLDVVSAHIVRAQLAPPQPSFLRCCGATAESAPRPALAARAAAEIHPARLLPRCRLALLAAALPCSLPPRLVARCRLALWLAAALPCPQVRSKDHRFVSITATAKTSSEVRVVDCAGPAPGVPALVRARQPDVEYFVDHAAGSFYIITNAPLPSALPSQVVPAPAPAQQQARQASAQAQPLHAAAAGRVGGNYVLARCPTERVLRNAQVPAVGAPAGTVGDQMLQQQRQHLSDDPLDTAQWWEPVLPSAMLDAASVKIEDMDLFAGELACGCAS